VGNFDGTVVVGNRVGDRVGELDGAFVVGNPVGDLDGCAVGNRVGD
jgi:hypothetical protein